MAACRLVQLLVLPRQSWTLRYSHPGPSRPGQARPCHFWPGQAIFGHARPGQAILAMLCQARPPGTAGWPPRAVVSSSPQPGKNSLICSVLCCGEFSVLAKLNSSFCPHSPPIFLDLQTHIVDISLRSKYFRRK